MNYATIKNCDISNGPGVRVSLFVSGCTHRCKGCFNEVAWDFNYGEPFTQNTIDDILKMLKPAYIKGLTLLGGEPFEPQNQQALLPFVQRVRSAYPHKTIWAFTGFTLEQLLTPNFAKRCKATDPLLALIDVLVDGRFVLAQKNISLRFRGSENQRLLDLPASLQQGKAVLWDR